MQRLLQLPCYLLCLLLLHSLLISAINLDCSDIVADKVHFNFKSLAGPKQLYRVRDHPPTITNTTFTLDICRPLEKRKGVPKGEDCPNGSRVCAIQNLTNTVEDISTIEHVIPIAGEFSHTIGGALDPRFTRLKSSASTADREKEGLRIELHGGKYDGQKQKAIMEFVCKKSTDSKTRQRIVASESDGDEDADEDGQVVEDGQDGTIQFVSWELEGAMNVLRLEWRTPFACEDSNGDGQTSKSSGHWGFFTWFIIIVFMGVAAYLIFGSWLNYTRYSARGWDLVPHSETIRDVPYLLQDWVRRVVSTVQGGPSRAGYSAV